MYASYEYQTTRLYHQCAGEGVPANQLSNKLYQLCGIFAKGAPSFQLFYYPPCNSLIGLSIASNTYTTQLQGMHNQSHVVFVYYLQVLDLRELDDRERVSAARTHARSCTAHARAYTHTHTGALWSLKSASSMMSEVLHATEALHIAFFRPIEAA